MSDDVPIEPIDYLRGLKVVDIGDLRVSRGKSRRPFTACRHLNLTLDTAERRIWCGDCETTIDPFDAFLNMAEHFASAQKALQRRQDDVISAEQFSLRSRAAKKIDQDWRRGKMVPACPHCGHGLFPEDILKSGTMLGKDFARALLQKKGDA